jgi:hypothetical protein
MGAEVSTAVFVPSKGEKRISADEPYVISVSAQFDTTTNDKDHDTLLDVSVFNNTGILIAQKTGIGGHWNDHTSAVVSLDLKNALGKSKVPAGRVDLAIHPNGNDKWEFNYHIDIVYSDSSVTEKPFNGKVLTQDNSTTSDNFVGQ